MNEKCAFDDQEGREEKAHANFQHVKNSSAPVCKKCGMFLVAKPKNGYTEFHCGNILEGCDYSEVVK